MISVDRLAALRSSPDRLTADWNFEPSPVAWRTLLTRVRLRHRRLSPPSSRIIRQVTPAVRWNCLFLFAPSGTLDTDQHQVVMRLRALQGRMLVIVATADGCVPAGLDKADALIWKELRGFDFSAYALALKAVARHSPGALVYLQNDSVLGPFGEIDGLVEDAQWDLTGFIASRAVENHLSSFALVLRDLTPSRVQQLEPALSGRWCHDDFRAVVLDQETRLASIAWQSMSVGAYWYMSDAPARSTVLTKLRNGLNGAAPGKLDLRGDPMLAFPLALLDRHFPFVKRSLFGKFAGLEDETALRQRARSSCWR